MFLTMPNFVAIVVPSTFGVSTPTDNSEILHSVESELCRLFGGSTTIRNSFGNWISDNGELVSESVDIVCAFSTAINVENLTKQIEEIAIMVRDNMRQNCVLYVVNGVGYLV